MMSSFSTAEKQLMTVTSFGHFMSHFNMLTFPALALPLSAGLDLPLADVMGLSFPMYLLFGLTALPWGMIGDRWRSDRLMVLFFLGAGLGGLGAAVFMESPAAMAASLGVVGLFSGIYHPIGLGMISKGVTRISVAMGINGMFGNLGLAMAPLLAGVANWLWGPRAAFMILAALNFAGALWAARLPHLKPPTRSTSAAESPSGNGRQAFAILLLAMMLGGIVYRGATLTTPPLLEMNLQKLHQILTPFAGAALTPNLEATIITSGIFLIGMIGQYTGGRAAERFDPRWCYLLFHASALPMAFMMATTTDLALVSAAVVYFFFLLGMQPAENTLVARLTPKRLHHSAFGVKFVLTFGVGALAVKLVEAIESALDLGAVFIALGVGSSLLVAAILLLIRRTTPAVDTVAAS
jgi:predicted MFS family arabinose efflux permease